MKLKLILSALSFFLFPFLYAQIPPLERIEPANWWIGMKNPNVQLIVHGNNIAERTVSINYPGVSLKKVNLVENPNYLFLDLEISIHAKSGSFPIVFQKKGEENIEFLYYLKDRTVNEKRNQGVRSEDFIYLIMPDRFANGDPKNDIVKDMQETSLDRDSMYKRHGGDLQGIIDHLDYIEELGVTALWLNPVLENDQPTTSYHGYANTENYKIDPRFGSNELYKKLVDESHKRGLKIIMDLVHNHIGSRHWTMLDLPMRNWVHQWSSYTKTNYREQVWMDPYVAQADKKIMVDGWFDNHMPDVDQANPFVKNYITQSHIWWLEYSGLDGFRLDTYAYNDLNYMSEWGKIIKEEFPQVTFFGETWVHGVPNQAYFTQGNTINQGIDTQLEGVTDFQALWGINEALNGKFGWMDGVARLYNVFANDFVYQDPTRNVVFLDNHDLSRFYSVIGEDFDKYKSGISWLLTTRGIPQLYYGTEILMKNFSTPDGLVREDFKGGWKDDQENKFIPDDRNAQENEAFNFVKTLANYRKNHSVLQSGKMMQFIPEEGIYVYFRYNTDQTIMVIMNSNENDEEIATTRFSERMNGFNKAVNVVSQEEISELKTIKIPAKTTWVLDLKK